MRSQRFTTFLFPILPALLLLDRVIPMLSHAITSTAGEGLWSLERPLVLDRPRRQSEKSGSRKVNRPMEISQTKQEASSS